MSETNCINQLKTPNDDSTLFSIGLRVYSPTEFQSIIFVSKLSCLFFTSKPSVITQQKTTIAVNVENESLLL